MGATFSPTVANIDMSVTLQSFLRTQTKQPLLLVRYIDDIFMIWTHTSEMSQKPHNLHQYLHYSSNHDKAIFKAIISGELVRYVRTNMLKEKYITMAKLLKTRLISRGYPIKLIDKTTATVQYEARDQLLSAYKKPQPRFNPPVYKCLLPPQFTVLKQSY